MSMHRHVAMLALATALALAGCATYQEDRDTTQPGKLQKAAFAAGPWYTLRTVVDAPYEASFTFIGEAGTMEKIQWDIQENYLYAYRTYEFVTGEDGPRKEADGNRFRGEPIAAYKIESHFDLWQQYNPVTGEEMPVLYEAQERPWYEREYFRVDWTENAISSFEFMGSQICEVQGLITKQPVAYAPNQPGDPLQVYYAQRTGDGVWQNHYDLRTTHELSNIDYIDVINREFVTLNVDALFGDLSYADAQSCLGYPTMPLSGAMQVTYRQSFMKMDPERFAQAEKVFYPDPSFEKFGYFRDERNTYDPNRGVTDFLGYQMHRWNIWQKTTNEDGTTIPIPEREIRKITYYLNAETPARYADVARKLIASDSWNRAFAAALKAGKHPSMNGKDPVGGEAADLPVVFEAKSVDVDCGPDGDLPCQQLGDLRYSFMYYVSRPSLGSPLGYGPSFADPETGEIVMAVANFYGAALDTSKQYIGELYDLIEGDLSETDIITGESVRAYWQNQGNGVLPPTFPQINLDPSIARDVREAGGKGLDVRAAVGELKLPQKALEVKHQLELARKDPGYGKSPYTLRSLAGTPVEDLVLEADQRVMLAGYPFQEGALSEELKEKISPFRNPDAIKRYNKHLDFWSRAGSRELRAGAAKTGCVVKAELYDDAAMMSQIERARQQLPEFGWDGLRMNGDEVAVPTREDVIEWIFLHTFRGVEEHEVGHTLGLRHNFEATTDEENYHDEYWDIVREHPVRPIEAFDADGDDSFDATEVAAWNAERIAVKRAREAAGVDLFSYASIMDYSMHFFYNDTAGIGKYDFAAIKYGYSNTVEVYADANNKGDHKENRSDVPYFLGGELCSASSECPANDQRFDVNGRVYAQQCRLAVTASGGAAQIGSGVAITDAAQLEDYRRPDGSLPHGACSNVYTELQLGEYDGWTPAQPIAPIAHPEHRFCSDERVEDRPFCSRYDEGRTAVEIVENTIEEYQRNYIFANFRRYRATFEPYFYYSRIFGRVYTPIGKIYQSMLYQLYYTPGFQTDPEKGLPDFLQASVLGLNFFGQVLTTPDVGAYKNWQAPGDPLLFEEDWQYGELYDPSPNMEMYVPLGIGKHLWSKWEQGYYGAIYRQARMGTYVDKMLAIEALSIREWGFPQANDESFAISFYDGFRDELLDMFGPMANDAAETYGPRVEIDPVTRKVSRIQYRNFWTGQFFGSDIKDWGLATLSDASMSDDFPAAQPGEDWRPMNPGGSFLLRLYSVIYSMSYFPVYYDNTFPGYVQLSVFNDVEPRNVAGLAGEGMSTYYSPKYKKLYAAPQTSDQRSFTHSMVERAQFWAAQRENWLTTPNPGALLDHPRCERASTGEECREVLVNQADRELEDVETLMNFTHDIAAQMGVAF